MAAVPARRDDPVSSAADSIESFVRLAQEGDSRAFEEVYRRTVGRVYAICLRMAGDGDEASELVQDVFAACAPPSGGRGTGEPVTRPDPIRQE
jgi:hypothetical protein